MKLLPMRSKDATALDRWCVWFPVLIVLPLGFLGCSPNEPDLPPISLEDASKLAAEFRGYEYKPPARTINDIKHFYGPREKEPESCNSERFLERPTQPPVSGSSNRKIWYGFFYRLYDAEQEFMKGNLKNSIEITEEAISHLPLTWNLNRGQGYFTLARYFAISKDTSSAEEAYATGRYLHFRGKRYNKDNYKKNRDRFESHEAASRASIALVTGKYREAESLFGKAIRRKAHTLGLLDIDLLRRDLTETLFRQGKLAEAESQARYNLEFIWYFDRTKSAILLYDLANVLFMQGRYQDAEWLVRRAGHIYRMNCVPIQSINVALNIQLLARILGADGRWREALRQFEAIEKALGTHDPERFSLLFASDPDWVLALLTAGRTEEAVSKAKLMLNRARRSFGGASYQMAEARGLLALAYWQGNDKARALKQFEIALSMIARLQVSDSVEQDSYNRNRRLRLIVEAYLDIAADGQSSEIKQSVRPPEALFELVQLVSGRSVQQAINANSARAAAGNSRLADLVRREQDLRYQVAATGNLLAYHSALTEAEQDRELFSSLKERLGKIRRARSVLLEEIENAFPEYKDLANPRVVSAADVRAALSDDEAFIKIHSARYRTYVWVISRERPVAFSTWDVSREDLSLRVQRLREALAPKRTTLGSIPKFDTELAHEIYSGLLAPVRDSWVETKSLIVAANSPLSQLPISLLPTERKRANRDQKFLFDGYKGIPWLVRSHAVTVLPSVSSLVTLRALPAGASDRRVFAGFADPVFTAAQSVQRENKERAEALVTRSPLAVRNLPIRVRSLPEMSSYSSAGLAELSPLPDTAEEVRAIANVLNADPTRDVFVGKDANEGQIKAMDLYGYRVLAFATHGLVPGDLNGLTQPALALSSPAVVGGEDDGLLTMGEILGLRLDADWVVLSACNTAAAEGKGAEAVSGLGRAFFYAGTRAILVSNWPVETTSANTLTTDLFRRQAADPNIGRAEALRQAMLGLLDGPGYVDTEGRPVFSYAHPIFWAPFSLVGDSRGTSVQTSLRRGAEMGRHGNPQ